MSLSKVALVVKTGMMKPIKIVEGSLRIWWKSQIQMEGTFHQEVKTPKEAKKLLTVLALYDLFQFENNIKPDFCNTGGLEVFEGGEWVEWLDDGYSIDEVDEDLL